MQYQINWDELRKKVEEDEKKNWIEFGDEK